MAYIISRVFKEDMVLRGYIIPAKVSAMLFDDIQFSSIVPLSMLCHTC